ncbi:MAG TPA: AMP-binding protein [Mycobacteriales bacterium]|nr:AMP-binding protein [Mycobacteriales bacterium]
MTQHREWSLTEVLDLVTAAAADRDMFSYEGDRRSFVEVASRTTRLAAYLRGRGLGVQRERDQLERWECGQSRVALVMSNCPEYAESMIGSYRARAVPFNVNQHYSPREIGALLAKIGADAIVYHRRYAGVLGEVDGLDGLVLIEVDDGSGVPPLAGSVGYEQAIVTGGDIAALPATSPDDLFLVCTGGTTGAPKGVLWRQADIYISAMGGTEDASAESISAAASNGGGIWFAAPPLMHAASQWTLFAGLLIGGTVVLHDDSRQFDARELLETLQRERVNLVSMVGDAYARPVVEELEAGNYDLSALVRIGIGGAFTSPDLKARLIELIPQVTIVDGYGASETGGMAYGASTSKRAAQSWAPSPGAAVLSAAKDRFLAPGEDEVGWTARVGRVPLGYLDDPQATARTFPVIDGQRVAVPGDRARLLADGSIVMLGRDSLVVNTGGEKVFVEEVEEVIRAHPAVLDALVVGRPSERFGQEVVALVQPRPGADVTPAEIRTHVAGSIARFKAPRAVLICDEVRRHTSGKADYVWAREAALGAVEARVDVVEAGR